MEEMKRLIQGPVGTVIDLEIRRSLPDGQEEKELVQLERSAGDKHEEGGEEARTDAVTAVTEGGHRSPSTAVAVEKV
jgi:hypothetical protein